MPTFMCFLNWTDQGAKNAKDAAKPWPADSTAVPTFSATTHWSLGRAQVRFGWRRVLDTGALLPATKIEYPTGERVVGRVRIEGGDAAAGIGGRHESW